ncbi:MAG: hypothetical protein AAFQ98_24045 [Bacteroidota bacterium]
MFRLVITLACGLSLLSTSQLPAQSFPLRPQYYKLYQADSLAQLEQYAEALVVYEMVFPEIPYVHTRILTRALQTAELAKDRTLIKKYRAQIKAQNDCPEGNQHLVHQIDSIFKWDQEVRTNKYWKAITYYRNHQQDSAVHATARFQKAQSLHDFSKEVDSLNILHLLNLMDTYGFLSEEMVGYAHFHKVDAMLLHFDADTNNQVLQPILDLALERGEILPHFYSRILDRHLYNTQGIQKYWTWFKVGEDPQLSQDEIERILKMREEIGLFGTTYWVDRFRDDINLSLGHLFY